MSDEAQPEYRFPVYLTNEDWDKLYQLVTRKAMQKKDGEQWRRILRELGNATADSTLA